MTRQSGRLATVETAERLCGVTAGESSATRLLRTTTEGLSSIELVSASQGATASHLGDPKRSGAYRIVPRPLSVALLPEALAQQQQLRAKLRRADEGRASEAGASVDLRYQAACG